MKKEQLQVFMVKNQLEELNGKAYYDELLEQRTAKWYLSADGEKAYGEADSDPKKLIFFYTYLRAIIRDKKEIFNKKGMDELYKIAFILTKAVAGTSLPFANYPDILQARKNPLVRYIDDNLTFKTLMAILCDEDAGDQGQTYEAEDRAYLNLTYCEGECTDIYKLERYLIWAFCSEPFAGPYSHDIIQSKASSEDTEE